MGATATITFSVTVNNPDTGDKVLAQTVTSATAGSNCAAGSTDARCSVTVVVLVPGLTIVQTASPGTTTPGSVVHYTVTVTNSGQTPYTGATFTDPLGGVLDDAAYNSDAAATGTGTVSFASPDLTWTGNLARGTVATITFSVTVNNPDTGEQAAGQHGHLGDGRAATARPGSGDPRCAVDGAGGGAGDHRRPRASRPRRRARWSRFTAHVHQHRAGRLYRDHDRHRHHRECSMTPTPNGDQTATSGHADGHRDRGCRGPGTSRSAAA